MSQNSNNSAKMPNQKELAEQIERNSKSDWPDLSDTQKLFGIRYVESYVISTAAKSVQVSSHTASSWLRQPLFMAYINELQALMNNRSVITKDFVNLQWLKLMPKLMGEEAVALVDKDGESYEAKKFHASESVRLLSEISKSTDFYVPEEKEVAAPSTNITFVVKSAKDVDAEDIEVQQDAE